MYTCTPECVYVHRVHAGACGSQEALAPLELELKMIVSCLIRVLGTKAPRRGVNANC